MRPTPRVVLPVLGESEAEPCVQGLVGVQVTRAESLAGRAPDRGLCRSSNRGRQRGRRRQLGPTHGGKRGLVAHIVLTSRTNLSVSRSELTRRFPRDFTSGDRSRFQG